MAFTVLAINLFAAVPSGELTENAKYIKENHNAEYELTIKKNALAEWGNDFKMVVYTINRQSDALVELVKIFEKDNTQIFYDAMLEWSTDGWKEKNKAVFQEMSSMSIASLMKLNCDWKMVLYIYKRQVKAKNAF